MIGDLRSVDDVRETASAAALEDDLGGVGELGVDPLEDGVDVLSALVPDFDLLAVLFVAHRLGIVTKMNIGRAIPSSKSKSLREEQFRYDVRQNVEQTN